MFWNDELPIADIGRKNIRVAMAIAAKGIDISEDDTLADISRKGFSKHAIFMELGRLPEENDLF